MQPMDIIIPLIILAIIGGAVAYIIRAKKRGQACIGCPHAGTCHACHGGCPSEGDSTSCCTCGCSSAKDDAEQNNP